MAPNSSVTTERSADEILLAATKATSESDTIHSENKETQEDVYNYKLHWRRIVFLGYMHLTVLYGLKLAITDAKWSTIAWTALLVELSHIGISAGGHRLWSHRSFKANTALTIILCVFQTLSIQLSVFNWVKDHRMHHKFNDTTADPSNAKRGFFFSHVGWLLVHKHPDMRIKGVHINMSDIIDDPVLAFQKKYYNYLAPIIGLGIPTFVPWYFWGENFVTSWFVAGVLRFTLNLNQVWLTNSYAHMFGNRPYDKNISSTDSLFLNLTTLGDGWHNFHHVFPWDYSSTELGNSRFTSFSSVTAFIDFFAKIGWAYDLKVVPVELVRKRMARTGDGSREIKLKNGKQLEDEIPVWGWDDKDMVEEDKFMVKELYAKG